MTNEEMHEYRVMMGLVPSQEKLAELRAWKEKLAVEDPKKLEDGMKMAEILSSGFEKIDRRFNARMEKLDPVAWSKICEERDIKRLEQLRVFRETGVRPLDALETNMSPEEKEATREAREEYRRQEEIKHQEWVARMANNTADKS